MSRCPPSPSRALRAALLGGLLVGCGGSPVGPLRVGVLPFVSSAPLFLAVDEGLFEAAGLDVELRFFQAAQPVAVAVASGDLDFGLTGLTAGFFNLAAGTDLRLLAAQAGVVPGVSFIAVCASPPAWEAGLRSVAELRGRRVGITQEGSTFHYMVGRLLEASGGRVDDARLVPLESVPSMVAALRGGGVDAALLPSHLALPLEREGAARIVGWVGDTFSWQLGALFTSQSLLEKRPEEVRAFVDAYREGARRYAESFLVVDDRGERRFDATARQRAERLRRWVPVEVETILEAAPFVPADAAIPAGSVAAQVRWFQERGLVTADLDPAALEGRIPVPEPAP